MTTLIKRRLHRSRRGELHVATRVKLAVTGPGPPRTGAAEMLALAPPLHFSGEGRVANGLGRHSAFIMEPPPQERLAARVSRVAIMRLIISRAGKNSIMGRPPATF